MSAPHNNGDGTYTLDYTITVENSGDVGLDSVQVRDDLQATFASASRVTVDAVGSNDFTLDSAYDGVTSTRLLLGTDRLAPGENGTIALTVTVTPGSRLGPYSNSARARAISTGGVSVIDVSTTGLLPDADGDGNPGSDSAPTEVTFTASPMIGIAKAVNGAPLDNGDGSYSVTYIVTVVNSGDVVLHSVQVTDSLDATFGGATGFTIDSVTSAGLTVNPGYDGTVDVNLLDGNDTLGSGQRATVVLTVRVDPGTDGGLITNSAFGWGTSPSGNVVEDVSTAGTEPDAGSPGDPVAGWGLHE